MSFSPKDPFKPHFSSTNTSPNEKNVNQKSLTPTLTGTSKTKSEFLSLAESPSQDIDSCAGNLFQDPKHTSLDMIYSSAETHDEPGIIKNEGQDVVLKENPNKESEYSEKEELNKESILNCKNWTNQDDQMLKELCTKFKTDWKKISKKFKAKKKKVTCYFLKTRYKELVDDPYLLRRKFTHEEDVQIAKYFQDYGTDWNKIAMMFPNRTGIMIKNRFYSHIKKKNLVETLTLEFQVKKEEDLDIANEHHDDNYPKENSKPIERNLQMSRGSEMNPSQAFQPALHHSMIDEPVSTSNFHDRQGDPLEFHAISNPYTEEEKSTANEQDELDNTSDGEEKKIEIETRGNVNRGSNVQHNHHREDRAGQTEPNNWVNDENFLLKLFFK